MHCPQVQGAETGGERGSGGRLLEVTEIATTDEKMPREEVLNNTGWTSADAERVCMLRSRPAVCRLAFTGAHQHHHLDHLIILVAPLELSGFGDATSMEALPRGDWWIFSPFCHHTINCVAHPEVCIAWFLLRACRRGERRMRVTTRATLALQPDFSVFWGPLWLLLRRS